MLVENTAVHGVSIRSMYTVYRINRAYASSNSNILEFN